MLKAIATRELFEVNGPNGGRIWGTYHNPHSDGYGTGRTGVVFLNGLPATRAAHGNAAVYWADSVAELGYPSFRIDLPGFGDSDGDPPEEWARYINLGGYGPIASAAIEEIAAKFKLTEVIVIGHCAGAVSAIYMATLNRLCKGLVLIDPYFYAAQKERAKTRQQISDWADRSLAGGIARSIFGRVKKTSLSVFRNAYPDHANVPLLRRWKEVARVGLPVLILKTPDKRSPGAKTRGGEFDYFKYVVGLARRGGKVTASTVVGANHTFSNQAGKAAVQQHVEQWLRTFFPIARQEGLVASGPGLSGSRSGGSGSEQGDSVVMATAGNF